ncbi:MAG: sulfite exporter TauE/SafE family protein [Euryarchaeota archaeon]|nr:sulfite exporter TauE/SafE family protein [Euryarchaeota archaeon]
MVFDGVETTSLIVVAILVAVVAFFYSNLGLGGGQLYVPIMILSFVSLEVKEIVPLSLMFAFVTMLSSTYTHSKKHLVDFRLGLLLAAAGLIGVAGGVLFTSTVDERVVKAGFATLLVIVATKMMFDIYKAKKDNVTSLADISTRRRVAGMGVSILIGFLVGSFGIGGGVVSVPLIIYVFRFEARKAIGTSALLGSILTPAAILVYVLTAEEGVVFHYRLALVLTPIVFVMAIIGSTWGLQKLKTPVVKAIFTGGVYLAASAMIYSLLFQ